MVMLNPNQKSRLVVEFEQVGSTVITVFSPEGMTPLQQIALGHLLIMAGEDAFKEIAARSEVIAKQ